MIVCGRYAADERDHVIEDESEHWSRVDHVGNQSAFAVVALRA